MLRESLRQESRQYPVDEVTGLPHLVLTVNTHQPITSTGRTNHHHLHFHRQDRYLEGRMQLEGEGGLLTRLDQLSLEKLAGLAVRVSRVERLEYELHDALHEIYELGPRNPRTLRKQFITTVKNCAGVASRTALDVTAPEDERFVFMEDDTYAMVTHPWRVHVEDWYRERPEGYQLEVLGQFFLRYAAQQDLSHIAGYFDEFLHTRKKERRWELGRQILQEGVEVSIEPLKQPHQELWQQGMVPESGRDLRQTVHSHTPPTAIAAVIPLLARQLAAA